MWTGLARGKHASPSENRSSRPQVSVNRCRQNASLRPETETAFPVAESRQSSGSLLLVEVSRLAWCLTSLLTSVNVLLNGNVPRTAYESCGPFGLVTNTYRGPIRMILGHRAGQKAESVASLIQFEDFCDLGAGRLSGQFWEWYNCEETTFYFDCSEISAPWI